MACFFAGRTVGSLNGEPSFKCAVHGEAALSRCVVCNEFVPRVEPESRDPGKTVVGQHPKKMIINRAGEFVDLAWLLDGSTAFAVLGGPSLASLDLEQLRRRGVLIFSTNNCPAALPAGIRPHVWLHTDPTHKFSDQLWRDPAVLKFSPANEWRAATHVPRPTNAKPKGIRRRTQAGNLEFLPGIAARNMPNCFGYSRNSTFDPANWLWEPSINRGNDKQSAATNGWPHCINTMFSLLRLAFYLGVKRLYLLGCDFVMRPTRPYAFDQGKHAKGCEGNNLHYAAMCVMFDALRPHLDAFGFEVINATAGSGCWSFPRISFDDALETTTRDFNDRIDPRGWYDAVNAADADDSGS